MNIFTRLLVFSFVLVTINGEIQSPKYVKPDSNEMNSKLHESSFLTMVDHFRATDYRVVRFPYLRNMDYYVPGGPIYMYIHDATSYTTQWIQTGLMVDIARQTNAVLITADHRYFAENRPTLNTSFENLQYLTIQQTLNDLAYMIITTKDHLDAFDAKVIVWGTGYGASLAAWLRQKFPHLVQGAWSSSGVYDASPYTNAPYSHLSDMITQWGGEQCADIVEEAFDYMANLVITQEHQHLQDALNLCYAVDYYSTPDTAKFFENQIQFIIDYINVFHYNGLLHFCNDLQTSANDPFHAYADWVNTVFGSGVACHNFSFVSFMLQNREIAWDTPGTISGARQWQYLRCTQLGLNKVSAYGPTLFTELIPQDYYFYTCNDILGPSFTYTKMYRVNEDLDIHFGGINPRVNNVIYTNGQLDPWYPLGIHELEDDVNSYVFDIPFYAQSADLTSISPIYDSAALFEVKNQIREIIYNWSY